MHRSACAVLVVLLAPAAMLRGQAAPAPKPISESVRALCQQDDAGRRALVTGELRKAGIRPVDEAYVAKGATGTNLVCVFGDAPPAIVLLAHFDKVRISPGANDNASGCAVLLRLALALQQRVQAAKGPTRRVYLVFLDGGSSGLTGAGGWLDRRAGEVMLGALNLDLVGTGSVAIGGPKGNLADDEAVRLLEEAMGNALAEDRRRILPQLPPSDHQAFLRRGVDAAMLMMAPKEDAEAFARPSAPAGGTAPRPRFLAEAGSLRDTPDRVSEDSLGMALRVAEAWIALAEASTAPGLPVRPDYARDQRAFLKLLASGAPEGLGARKGPHVDLMAALGPHGAWRCFLTALDEHGAAAEPAVVRLLLAFVAGPELRKPLSVLVESDSPIGLREGLADLYLRNRSRLVWDPAVPAITVRKP